MPAADFAAACSFPAARSARSRLERRSRMKRAKAGEFESRLGDTTGTQKEDGEGNSRGIVRGDWVNSNL